MGKLLTKKLVKWFENEQKEYGTRTAIFNLVFIISTDLLKSIGVTSIKTKSKK